MLSVPVSRQHVLECILALYMEHWFSFKCENARQRYPFLSLIAHIEHRVYHLSFSPWFALDLNSVYLITSNDYHDRKMVIVDDGYQSKQKAKKM